jgi:flavin reductase (DIM6/NTAB) family NADH-FMN oxidoreductase RutF
MAMPVGWQNHWCFVCSPRHGTYRNIKFRGEFTASFPAPDQMVVASMAAGPRGPEGVKPSLEALDTFPARTVDGVLVQHSRLWLECELERIIDGFGENSIVVGTVVAAAAPEDSLRSADKDDADLLHSAPLTAYVGPGRFASVGETYSFPYHVDYQPHGEPIQASDPGCQGRGPPAGPGPRRCGVPAPGSRDERWPNLHPPGGQPGG